MSLNIEKNWKVFLEFSNNQDSDTREKHDDFVFECSSTSAVFSIEILVEGIELVVVDN